VRYAKYARYAGPLALVVLVGQTNTTTPTADLTAATSLLTTLLMALLPVILVIAVVGLVFKMLGRLFEGLGRAFAVRLAPGSAVMLVAETSSSPTIDLSPMIALLMGILPFIITIAVIVLIFRMLGNLFEGLGKVFSVKINGKNWAWARLAPLATTIAIAQTSGSGSGGSVSEAINAVQALSPILMNLITIVILIALPLLIFKVLGKAVLDIIRG